MPPKAIQRTELSWDKVVVVPRPAPAPTSPGLLVELRASDGTLAQEAIRLATLPVVGETIGCGGMTWKRTDWPEWTRQTVDEYGNVQTVTVLQVVPVERTSNA